MKVLKREFYNNGYGCSCCRKDWEEISWIDETEMPTVEEFFTEYLRTFDLNASQGGIVGISYESNGEILFGIEPQIYSADWNFVVKWGNVDYPTVVKKVRERIVENHKHTIKYYSEDIINKYKEEHKENTLTLKVFELLNIKPEEIFQIQILPDKTTLPFLFKFSDDLKIKKFKEDFLMENGGYWEDCFTIFLNGFFNGVYKIVKFPI
jgi:hypothetical protein